jgi:hypothetical protein
MSSNIHYIFFLGWFFHYQLQDEIWLNEWLKKPKKMQTFKLPTRKFSNAFTIYKNIYKRHLQK